MMSKVFACALSQPRQPLAELHVLAAKMNLVGSRSCGWLGVQYYLNL